jgi:hypothetical protein
MEQFSSRNSSLHGTVPFEKQLPTWNSSFGKQFPTWNSSLRETVAYMEQFLREIVPYLEQFPSRNISLHGTVSFENQSLQCYIEQFPSRNSSLHSFLRETVPYTVSFENQFPTSLYGTDIFEKQFLTWEQFPNTRTS